MSDRPISYVAPGPIPPSPPPAATTGAIGWLRENLFAGPVNTIVSLISLALIVWMIDHVVAWSFLNAVWEATSLRECREIADVRHAAGQSFMPLTNVLWLNLQLWFTSDAAAVAEIEAALAGASSGACWAVIVERFDQFIYGFYPDSFPLYERWRPNLAFILMVVAIAYLLFDNMPFRGVGLVFAALYPLIAYFLIWGGSIWGPLLMLATAPVIYFVFTLISRFLDPIFAVAGSFLAAALWLLFVVAPGDEMITRAVGDARYDDRVAELQTFLNSDIEAYVRDGAADELEEIEDEAARAEQLADYAGRARNEAEAELENLRALPEREARLDDLRARIDALQDTLPSELVGLDSTEDLESVEIDLDAQTRAAFQEYLDAQSEADSLESRVWFTYKDLGRVGLPPVESRLLGGFLLATIIGVAGIALSLPIGIVLALGRRSGLIFVQTICITFIEFIRGVPLITLLFVANSVLAYFFPPGSNLDLILRVVIMVTLFASAYMAEVIRGGLAALGQGQYEAADSLGLDYWKSMRLIILPQALKISIPNIVSTFIGLFKDTTLVVVIGLLDPIGLINTTRADSAWNGIIWEFYVFVGLFFFVVCFGMSRYALYLERKLKTDR